ncbi:hypothetical protein C8R46DRAFT_1107299 [Mycena filopes]|nr:hypothetical protein C8R46DRAFT_1107299 [Mycena filopes]
MLQVLKSSSLGLSALPLQAQDTQASKTSKTTTRSQDPPSKDPASGPSTDSPLFIAGCLLRDNSSTLCARLGCKCGGAGVVPRRAMVRCLSSSNSITAAAYVLTYTRTQPCPRPIPPMRRPDVGGRVHAGTGSAAAGRSRHGIVGAGGIAPAGTRARAGVVGAQTGTSFHVAPGYRYGCECCICHYVQPQPSMGSVVDGYFPSLVYSV